MGSFQKWKKYKKIILVWDFNIKDLEFETNKKVGKCLN